MDRNTIIGFALIFLILIGYTIYSRPSEEQIAAEKRRNDSIAMVDSLSRLKETQAVVMASKAKADSAKAIATLPDSIRAKQDSSRFGVFVAAATGTEKTVTIENEKLKVEISTKGGAIKRVELKEFKTYDQFSTNTNGQAAIFDGKAGAYSLKFYQNGAPANTNDFYFDTQDANVLVKGNDSASVSLKLNAGNGRYLEYIYSLKGNSYMVGFKVKSENLNSVIDPKQVAYTLDWKDQPVRKERDIKREREFSTIYYKYADDDVDYLSLSGEADEKLEAKAKWISFKQQFFSATLIADQAFEKPIDLSVKPLEGNDEIKTMSASVSIPYNHTASETFGMRFYFGPNHYNTLKQYDLDMEDQIQLGSFALFVWVNKYVVIPVFHFLDGFNLNYGIVILILTLLIKLLILPLTYKAYLSTAKMRILKPDIDAITAKIPKEDALARQQATMDVYRKAGVSPMGGCLPQLLQLPILLALFSFFPSAIELRQQSFLWAEDLSTYDSIATLPFSIPFYGNHVSLFTLLMTASTLLFTWVNSKYQAQDQQFKQLKWMMYLMPIIFLGVLNSYPAGLSYYYFISTMMSIAIQEIMRRRVDEKALHAKIQENRKNPKVAKKSGFQQRMEDMAKQRGMKLPENKPKKK